MLWKGNATVNRNIRESLVRKVTHVYVLEGGGEQSLWGGQRTPAEGQVQGERGSQHCLPESEEGGKKCGLSDQRKLYRAL